MKIHVIGIGDTGAKITQEMCSAGHSVNAVDVWKNSFEKLPPELVDTKYINNQYAFRKPMIDLKEKNEKIGNYYYRLNLCKDKQFQVKNLNFARKVV